MKRWAQFENDRPVLNEDETFDFELTDVSLYFKPTDSYGPGRIFITNRRIIWTNDQAVFDFDVPYISLHAVSRDPSSFPLPCLYCQLGLGDDDEGDHEEEEDEFSEPSELYLVPKDESTLITLFEAFSRAALLNPDPVEEGDELDDDDGGDLIYNIDEVQLGAEQARMLDHLESVFTFPATSEYGGGGGDPLLVDVNGVHVVDEAQFDDADEEEGEGDDDEEEEVDGGDAAGAGMDLEAISSPPDDDCDPSTVL